MPLRSWSVATSMSLRIRLPGLFVLWELLKLFLEPPFGAHISQDREKYRDNTQSQNYPHTFCYDEIYASAGEGNCCK